MLKLSNMQGITLYIILGVLVFMVIMFLLISSILDRKKRKKWQLEEIEKNNEIKKAHFQLAILLNFVIESNNKLLKKFVPSIGKIKMFNIKSKAQKSLTVIEKSQTFKYAKLSDNKTPIKIFKKLKENNSNIWNKKNTSDLQNINNLIKSKKLKELKNKDIKKTIKLIKGIYENDNSK